MKKSLLMETKNNQPLLKLENIVKEYKTGESVFRALNDVSLEINEGEYVSIVGPSGSGKSTLMHIIGLLDNPTYGKIFFDGQDVSNLKEPKLALIRNKGIGFVFQQFNLLPKTSSVENVLLPLLYSDISPQKRIFLSVEMLNKVGLSDKLRNFPSQLSGGQQQRVAIARALINNPRVIFADEPTGNLDTNSGKEIIALFHKLNREEKRTIVIVTHDLIIARQAKRIIEIRDGKIVSSNN